MSSNSDDARLIVQTLTGQNESFWELVRPYLPSVFRVVRIRMRQKCEAEDVLQNTLLKAFAQLHQFRFESSFSTWLTQIAINEVRQCYRSAARSRLCALEDCGITEEEIGIGLPSQLESCERQEQAEQIGRTIAALPDKYRVVLELREFKHLSIVDTARVLRLSTSAVKSRHRRARQQIGRRLNHYRKL